MEDLRRAVRAGSLPDMETILKKLIRRERVRAVQDMCVHTAMLAIDQGQGQFIKPLLTCKAFHGDANRRRLKEEIPNLVYHASGSTSMSERKISQIMEILASTVSSTTNSTREITEYLNEDGFASLHLAAMNCNVLAAKRLLELGAVSKQPSLDGNTALSIAIANNHPQFWEFILPLSDVNTRDEDRDTPLMFAAWRKEHRLVAEMIQLGADVNMRSRHGSSAIWNAVYRTSYDSVIVLLQNNADMNVCCEGTFLFADRDEDEGTLTEVRKVYPGRKRSLLWTAVDNAGRRTDKTQALSIIAALLGSGYDVTKEDWVNSMRSASRSRCDSDLPCGIGQNQALRKLLIFLYTRPMKLKDICRNCLRRRHRDNFRDVPYQKWVSKLGLGDYMTDFMSSGFLRF